MTGTTSPDIDDNSDASSSDESNVVPLLTHQDDSSSDDDSTTSNDDSTVGPPPLAQREDDSSSDDDSLFGGRRASTFHYGTDSSDYWTGNEDDSFTTAPTEEISSQSSSVDEYDLDDLGPPPPGSLMSYWNTPFSTGCLHNFPSRVDEAKCSWTYRDSDEDSINSADIPGNDDDSYAAFNPAHIHPSLALTRVVATPRVIGLTSDPIPNKVQIGGNLIDTGGNFNMTNDLSLLVNVVAIKPFPISMAAKETESTSKCTHRGDFPLPMNDGSIFYTPMFYNAQASDSILSPESICESSNGLLERWSQSGNVATAEGNVLFYDSQGAEVISLTLNKRNGLYYTPIQTIAVNGGVSINKHTSDGMIYFHTPEGVSDDDVSICTIDEENWTHLASPTRSGKDFAPPTASPPIRPQISPPKAPPIPHPIEIPTTTPQPIPVSPTPIEFIPKSKQIEADLWQARLGHCNEWQLKVLPMSTEGTPANFQPHPFASYDHYNQARIRKRPATRGKHPSRAVGKNQRLYMDFGFMRASTLSYDQPNKEEDRVVTSYDGYNCYLIVVDEYTKFTWVYLRTSKEPPIDTCLLHLDQLGSKAGYIRCDKGGELAKCAEWTTAMVKRGYIVEPTGSDSPDQNKQAEKWNDTFGVTTRVLLYGSGFTALFWSAALLHACYLHNRRVHKSILMTPFEAYYGFKPDLRNLRVFGARVCVKRTGKRRSKLNRHDFTGIFLGFTATDENFKYIDVNTRIEKTSHHGIFDEAWYLQSQRPPFAQMLYDVGLEPELTETDLCVIKDVAPPPPLPSKPPSKLPLFTTRIPLPLRVSTPPTAFAAAAAHTKTEGPILVEPKNVKRRLEHDMIMKHDITKKDLDMVYLSPSCFLDAFEEELDLRRFDPTKSPTAGIICRETSE
jgi:hypothetical protein